MGHTRRHLADCMIVSEHVVCGTPCISTLQQAASPCCQGPRHAARVEPVHVFMIAIGATVRPSLDILCVCVCVCLCVSDVQLLKYDLDVAWVCFILNASLSPSKDTIQHTHFIALWHRVRVPLLGRRRSLGRSVAWWRVVWSKHSNCEFVFLLNSLPHPLELAWHAHDHKVITMYICA